MSKTVFDYFVEFCGFIGFLPFNVFHIYFKFIGLFKFPQYLADSVLSSRV